MNKITNDFILIRKFAYVIYVKKLSIQWSVLRKYYSFESYRMI